MRIADSIAPEKTHYSRPELHPLDPTAQSLGHHPNDAILTSNHPQVWFSNDRVLTNLY